MILVIRPDATLDQIEHVIERVRELGFTPHVSRGEARTIVGVIGDETKPQTENFSAIPGVEQVLRILKPFKLASREFHKADSVVYVGKVRGGGSLAMIAGPVRLKTSRSWMPSPIRQGGGANILRGGAFKPRTSPYSFQGLGEEGLKILREVGDTRHAGGDRGHGPPPGRSRRNASRHVPNRCAEHAELRPPKECGRTESRSFSNGA